MWSSLGKTDSTDRVWAFPENEGNQDVGLVIYGLDDLIGWVRELFQQLWWRCGNSQELSHRTLFSLLWLAWELPWHLWVCHLAYPMSEVRGGGWENLSHVQGKEQRLRFAGAAMKRYPTSKVRETQVREVLNKFSIRHGCKGHLRRRFGNQPVSYER